MSVLAKVSSIVDSVTGGSSDASEFAAPDPAPRGPAEKGINVEQGLHMKKNRQEGIVDERSRLQEADLFVPHVTHEVMVNTSAEHMAVAKGLPVDSEIDSAAEARQV
ncbi:hypothetical protein P7C70_g1278, partial [Phenoliferia sp. Uapishka_3]